MKFCDITMAYNARSGGIRTYIDEKRRFLREHTDHEHLLIVPGERTRVRRSDRSTTVTLRGPLLPGQSDYRVFLTPAAIRKALISEQPDIVEFGSTYAEPWAAFAYRRRRREAGATCIVGGYFHTDIPEAYVSAPLRGIAHEWLEDVSETLALAAEKVADVAASGAERYMRTVYNACDLVLAPSDTQAQRLAEYGVEGAEIAPLGVDLKLFTPRRRMEETRARLGAGPRDTVLIYAGRLGTEKRVPTLIEAFGQLPEGLAARLWLVGDGPLRAEVEAAVARNPAISLLPHETDRRGLADLLAAADIYVTAGPFETFGLSVLEAQASGLPVVGVAAGALIERVPEGVGFLGPVYDADVMAANITRVAEKREALAANARRHAEDFAWRHTFASLLKSYAAHSDEPERIIGAAMRAPAQVGRQSRAHAPTPEG